MTLKPHTTHAANVAQYERAVDLWHEDQKSKTKLDAVLEAASYARSTAPTDPEWEHFNTKMIKAREMLAGRQAANARAR